MRYDAFISYSHAVDGKLAPALQRALERYAKPWYRRRALHIFRDETNLSANPHLWQSIIDNLNRAEWFLLMASPEAAKSKWVRKEIEWWIENRTSNRLLILLTEGEVIWDGKACDFDWDRTTAIPKSLSKIFSDEPLYIDLRWARSETSLTLRHAHFRSTVLKVAAPVHRLPMDEMDGEAVRTYRKNIASALILIAMLIVSLIGSVWQWRVANYNYREAKASNLASAARELLKSDRTKALRMAEEAYSLRPTNPPVAVEQILSDVFHTLFDKTLFYSADLTHNQSVTTVEFSPDGQKVLTGSKDTTAKIWSLDGELLATLRGHADEILTATFSAEGNRILTNSKDGIAKLWNLSGNLLATYSEHIVAASFSPNGQTVLTASPERTAVLWDLSGRVLATFEPSRSAIFSPEGKHIFTIAPDLTGKLWDTNGNMLRLFPDVRDATFSSDGSKLLTISKQKTAVLSDLAGNPIQAFGEEEPLAFPPRFSPNGNTILIVKESGKAELCDLQGNVIANLNLDPEVTRAIISPDGRSLLTTSKDADTRLLDLEGNILSTIPVKDVWWIDFSPDSQKIALTRSLNPKAFILDRHGIKVLGVAAQHTGPVFSGSFSLNAEYFAP